MSGWLLDWSGPCQVGCLTGQVRVRLVAWLVKSVSSWLLYWSVALMEVRLVA